MIRNEYDGSEKPGKIQADGAPWYRPGPEREVVAIHRPSMARANLSLLRSINKSEHPESGTIRVPAMWMNRRLS